MIEFVEEPLDILEEVDEFRDADVAHAGSAHTHGDVTVLVTRARAVRVRVHYLMSPTRNCNNNGLYLRRERAERAYAWNLPCI